MFNSRKVRRRAGAGALCLALFASACGGTAVAEDAAAPNATETIEADTGTGSGPGLPQLVGNTVAGSQFDTSDLAGQDIAVWFWAPW